MFGSHDDRYVMPVTGTHIWYYYVCKREVWLMTHQIAPDQDDDNLDIGRFINKHTHQRYKQEMSIGSIKVDRIRREDGKLIIGEIKKSSSFIKSARYQLLYYLRTLKEMGIHAEGELLFPEEKKREKVFLTEKEEKELDKAVDDIRQIARLPVAPKPVKIGFCRRCAYREYCWAGEDE